MEVMPGYKQTEAGILPEEWSAPMFGDLVRSSQLGGNYKNTDIEDEWALVKMGNLGRGHISLKKIEYLVPGQSPLSADVLHDGDLLFNTRNTLDLVGKTALWRGQLPRAVFDLNIMRLGFRGDRVGSSSFMNYAMNTDRFTKALRSIAIGTTSVAAIYGRDLFKLPIALPPKPEQQAIAEALSDGDALIESLEQLIAKKRQVKQGAMQELLTGKRRLPGFETRPGTKQTELGRIPSEWGLVALADLCVPGGLGLVRGPFGGTLKKEYFVRDGFQVYEQRHAIYGAQVPARYFIDERKYHELSRFQVSPGDFIVSCSGTIGRICRVPASARPGVINQALLKLRTDDSVVEGSFFLYAFGFDSFQARVVDNTHGGAMQNLVGMSVFRETRMVLPTLPEQEAIAAVLSDMDSELEALEAKLNKARQIHQEMMHNLLTGKVRLV